MAYLTPANGQGMAGNNKGGGSYRGGNTQGANKESNKRQQPEGKNNSGGGGHCRQPWVDNRHPRIIAMMADYIAAWGLRVQLNEILDASNKCITDLPMIPEYVNNSRPLCAGRTCWEGADFQTVRSRTDTFHAAASPMHSQRKWEQC